MIKGASVDNEYDIFEGTPQEKWLEILYNASAHLTSAELLHLLERLALLESYLDRHDSAWEERINQWKDEAKEELRGRIGSLAIESMGRILSNNE